MLATGPAARGRRRLATALVVAAAAAAVPSVATATVDVVPSNDQTSVAITVRNLSGPDGDHGMLMGFGLGGFGVAQQRFGDPTIEAPSPPCSRDFLANRVSCPVRPATVTLDLGDGADDVGATVVGIRCVLGAPDAPDRPRLSLTGTLGDGADRFSLPASGIVSDDDCSVNRSDAPRFDVVTVDGGAGSDTFRGASDVDRAPRLATWSGSTGADTFVDGVGPEVFIGGANRDTVSYLQRTEGLLLSPGSTAFGDGPDGDDIRADVEVVIGGQGDDQFFGNDGRNELRGGPGADRYLAAGGDDLVVDVDGIADRVDCGPGTDEAQLDLRDVVVATRIVVLGRLLSLPTCENVSRFAADDGPPARVVARAVTLASPSVGLACPRSAKVRCRGTLVLRDPARPRGAIARRRYDVPLGATRSIPLALADAQRRTLRARGSVIAETVERGASRKGPRSARRHLRVVG